MEEIMCCEPRIDTFIAEMEIDPGESREFRRTTKEKKRIALQVLQRLQEMDDAPYFEDEG